MVRQNHLRQCRVYRDATTNALLRVYSSYSNMIPHSYWELKVSRIYALEDKTRFYRTRSQAEAGEDHVARCGTNTDPIFLEEYKDQGAQTSLRFISLLG